MGAKRKQYQEITLPESNPDSLLTATSAHAEPGIFEPRSWGPKLVDLMFPVTLDDVAQTQMGAFTPEEHKIAESTYKAWESGVERDVVALLASPLGFVPSTALAIQDAGRDIADWWSGEGGLWPAAQSVLQAAGGLTQLAPVEQREIYVKPWDLNSLEDVHEAHQRYLETGETTVLQGDSPGPPYEGQILLPPAPTWGEQANQESISQVFGGANPTDYYPESTTIWGSSEEPVKLISEVERIFDSRQTAILEKDQILEMVEEPLRAAVGMLSEKRVATIGTSANAMDVSMAMERTPRGYGQISIDYTLLSDENKAIADTLEDGKIVHTGIPENFHQYEYGPPRSTLTLHYPGLDDSTTVNDIELWSTNIAKQFKPQTGRYYDTENPEGIPTSEYPLEIFEEGSGRGAFHGQWEGS